ncbi:hypothetical protein B0H14DRAFT_2342001, partial [Mycena olivaceomarginata]
FLTVQSSSNIPIESTWSYDHKLNGRTIQDVLEEGRIHLIPGDNFYSLPRHVGNLFCWLWSKIVQIGLDEFLDYFNNKKTPKQRNRILPSGVAPNVVFNMPADYSLQNLAILVPQEAVQGLRGLIETLCEEVFRWVSDEFDMLATNIYNGLGSPKLETLSGWGIFNALARLIHTEINSAV